MAVNSTQASTPGTVANAVWNTVNTVCTLVISVFSAPVLIRSLGTSKYGVFLLIGSLTGLLGIMSFGLGEATLRYVARHYRERDLVGINRVFGATLSLYVLVAAVVSLLVFGATSFVVTWLNIGTADSGNVYALVRIATAAFAVRIVTSVFSVLPSALQRYDITSKINIAINTLRSGGYLAIALAGLDLIHLILWDFFLSVASGFLWVSVARRLLPALRLLPSTSLHGLKEIAGYSIMSFLTWTVHTMHRESGKLLLARMLGTAPVAYLGTPDNITQRMHVVVASGAEVLLSRFSADRESKESEPLFWNATWTAVTLSLILLIPLMVLMPDFLALWINPSFAKESALAGQLLAIYLVFQGAFAPTAAYFRGTGKPGYVTAVIAVALVITVVTSLQLIPSQGVVGVGLAYLLGSAAPLLGTVMGGISVFGRKALPNLGRALGLPLLTGLAACGVSVLLRSRFGDLTWVSLLSLAAAIVVISSALIVGADWLAGGPTAASKQLISRITNHNRFLSIARWSFVR